MTDKSQLGQFYTKNYSYILQGMSIPRNINKIIEPFVGQGDLLSFIASNSSLDLNLNVDCYDIEPKIDPKVDLKLNLKIFQRDTLLDPPDYNGAFVLTNPPYLARNKAKDKSIFDKYDTNDLYKAFLWTLIKNRCLGGIIIIPLNFWCSVRPIDIKLREKFLLNYKVHLINVFEESVFDDTSYTVCSILFEIRDIGEPNLDQSLDQNLKMVFYPKKETLEIKLVDYIIGGEIYKKTAHNFTITRLTKDNIKYRNTNILVKCIDDSKSNTLGLSLVKDDEIFIDQTENLSARSYATLIIDPPQKIKEKIKTKAKTKTKTKDLEEQFSNLSLETEVFVWPIEMQKILILSFNKYISTLRNRYNSLFLTNYRESKDISRKRISFDLVYSICDKILSEYYHAADIIGTRRIKTLNTKIKPLKCICPSYLQTKEWRKDQPWYSNGKKNECEKYQIKMIEDILGTKLERTTERINSEKNIIQAKAQVNGIDGFEWTENFDGTLILNDKTYYFNLKFVCDVGGAQTRTLREVYHFIKAQLDHLVYMNSEERNDGLVYKDGDLIFVNILDGDTCSKNMPKFRYLLNKKKYADVKHLVFVGDLCEYRISIL